MASYEGDKRYRQVIMEEGVVYPLLRLLKDGRGSLENKFLVNEIERTRNRWALAKY